MAITFKQIVTPWSNSSPATSTSFTVAAAGDTIIVFCDDYAGNAVTFSGTGGTYAVLTPPGSYTDLEFDEWTSGACLSAASGAQTITITGTAGDGVIGIAIDFSGVASITGKAATNQSAPGKGAGAIQGTATTVPTGSVLLAFCSNVAPGTSDTITAANGGTTLGNGAGDFNQAYGFGSWAGAGASITPEFTSNVGTSDYTVMTFLLTPPVAASTFPVPSSFFVC